MDALTDAEAERLNQLLLDFAGPEGMANLEMLDGFLSALVVAPAMILPSEWLPVALGSAPGAADAGQTEQLSILMLRFYNEIVTRVGRAPTPADDTIDRENFPYLMMPPEDEAFDLDATEPAIGALWASGFLAGRMVRADDWDRLCDDWDGLAEDLDEFDSLHACLDADDPGDPLPLRVRFDVLLAIPELLHDLYNARPLPEPIRRAEPKVGRNDPCPCGSGLKYNKCHGSN